MKSEIEFYAYIGRFHFLFGYLNFYHFHNFENVTHCHFMFVIIVFRTNFESMKLIKCLNFGKLISTFLSL